MRAEVRMLNRRQMLGAPRAQPSQVRGLREIEVGASERKHLVARLTKGSNQLVSQLAGGAGDGDAPRHGRRFARRRLLRGRGTRASRRQRASLLNVGDAV